MPDALTAIAKKAIQRKTGARGLRAIMEEILLEVMYDVPGTKDVKEVVINKGVVEKHSKPVLVYTTSGKSSTAKKKKAGKEKASGSSTK